MQLQSTRLRNKCQRLGNCSETCHFQRSESRTCRLMATTNQAHWKQTKTTTNRKLIKQIHHQRSSWPTWRPTFHSKTTIQRVSQRISFFFFSFIMAQSMAAYVIGPIQLEKREGKREWKIYFRYQTISAQFWDKCAIMRPWWWFNVTCHCNFPAGVSKKPPSQSDATSCISIDN